mmetsp:Transcript_92672/g.113502  ORF Transcript_92672/g.113502 Transcript_92672/m.113502 type:complete len:442 (-) Transcript_92672:55-1380(-)
MAVLADTGDSREWQDVLRISEDLRQAVCRIHAKLASEREILVAERAAAAAERAAAAAEREQAERLVKMISAAAERCNAWTGAKEATQMSGRAMPGQSTAAPKGVVVKQPPQRPAQSMPHAAPTNGSYPLAAPPMPSRSPPPCPVPANAESAEPIPGPRVKAPPNQGRRAASSVPAAIPEVQSKETEAKARVQSQESGSTGSSSAILATPPGKDNDEAKEDIPQEAPAQNTPKRSNPSTDEAAEEAAAVAPTNESCNGTRVEPLLDDLEEDEMDEHDLWAMHAPSPPSKAHPTECPHYRVMPPPRADPLPSDQLTPDSDEMDTGLSLPPEEDREYAPTEEAFESELERGAEDSSASRVPVKAMPGRDGPSSSAWPVGKAAASRYKAPPAALFGSSASSSDRRETMGSEVQAGSASSVTTPEASAGLTTSSVKAPPHRSTPSG